VVEQGAAAIRQLLQQQVRPLETVPPNRTLPGGGVGDIPTLEQVPPNGTLPGGGVGIPTLQQQEGEPPLPVVCSEEAGLQKDPETGQCVPIEPPPSPSPPRGEDAEQATEEPGEQPDQDDEQSSEDGDSSEQQW
jgi:hypothetical protein